MTVSEVCPQTTTLDCVPEHKIVRTSIGLGLFANFQTGNVAMSPSGQQLALVGKQGSGDVIAVVLMPSLDGGAPIPTESVETPEPTDTPEATQEPSTPTPEATASPTDTPQTSEPAQSPDPSASTASTDAPQPTETAESTPTADATPTVEATPTGDATPTVAPTPTVEPTPEATPEPTPEPTPNEPTPPATTSPPESAVPGLAVLSILEDVHSAGSPPAWSRNGSMLAFSAMPSDGSHGPDVYVWSPEDTRARPITSDHVSHFASWSGNRIVISRMGTNAAGEVVARNFVIDPVTLEERRTGGGQIWLPSVNRQRTQAVVWRGELGVHDGAPELRSGGLYLMDWTAVDPFRPTETTNDDGSATPLPEAGQPPAATPAANDDGSPTIEFIPLNPDRDDSSAPVVDWHAGWSPDGRVLGIWIADSPGSGWGRLTILAIDPENGELRQGEPVLGTTLARRGFALGSDRVAWVAPSDDNVDGELRIRAWTSDGVGGLRIVSDDEEEVLPAF
jgi:hypothetical protein